MTAALQLEYLVVKYQSCIQIVFDKYQPGIEYQADGKIKEMFNKSKLFCLFLRSSLYSFH